MPKNTPTFPVVINPQSYDSTNPCNYDQNPDPNYSNLNKEVPNKQKDSAINVCSLNIRSLTIKEDSVKLKRLFKLDSSIIVLTEVCMDETSLSNLFSLTISSLIVKDLILSEQTLIAESFCFFWNLVIQV